MKRPTSFLPRRRAKRGVIHDLPDYHLRAVRTVIMSTHIRGIMLEVLSTLRQGEPAGLISLLIVFS